MSGDTIVVAVVSGAVDSIEVKRDGKDVVKEYVVQFPIAGLEGIGAERAIAAAVRKALKDRRRPG